MVTATITAFVAPPAPSNPAAPPSGAGNAGEPGAFARQLERAAQQGDGADAAATPPAQEAANPARDVRAKARPGTDRSSKTERAPARSAGHEDTTTSAAGDDKADAAPAAAHNDSDLPALLAELMARQAAAAPAAPRADGAAASDAARGVAAAEARRGSAATAQDGATELRAKADVDTDASLPALRAESASFMLPQPGAQPNNVATASADSSARAAPTPYAAQIDAPVGSPDFAPGLSAQVSLMLRDGIQEARLQLNPAEMGPMTVQIQVDGSTAQVTMTAEQAPTRDALEQAMPTLAGALREEGLTLTGGGVFEQPRQPRDDAPAPQNGSRSGGGSGGSDPVGTVAAPPRWSAPRGVVDVYA